MTFILRDKETRKREIIRINEMLEDIATTDRKHTDKQRRTNTVSTITESIIKEITAGTSSKLMLNHQMSKEWSTIIR